MCFEYQIFNHKKQSEQDYLSYPYPGYHEYSEEMLTIYSKHNTEAIFKDYSSNLRYILYIYRESGSIQISVFCYRTIFSYTDSYHPHKCLKIDFFKPLHIQFHQAFQPSDKLYPSFLPLLLEEDCSISIFGGEKKSNFYFTLHYKMSSINFFRVWEIC